MDNDNHWYIHFDDVETDNISSTNDNVVGVNFNIISDLQEKNQIVHASNIIENHLHGCMWIECFACKQKNLFLIIARKIEPH